MLGGVGQASGRPSFMISPTRPSPGFMRVTCTAPGFRPSVANSSMSPLARRR